MGGDDNAEGLERQGVQSGAEGGTREKTPESAAEGHGGPQAAGARTGGGGGTRPPGVDTGPGTGAAWLGGAFWVIVLAIAYFVWFSDRTALVMLNASGTHPRPLTVSGLVTYGGDRVPGGALRVVIERPRDGAHLASRIVGVQDGEFSVDVEREPLGDRVDGLRVSARYTGKRDKQTLSGAATLYVNQSPPWSLRWLAVVVLAYVLALVFLFTGSAEPGRLKARLLFGLTYVTTFSALVVPIVITVFAARDPHFVELMQDAPIGILKARARGLDEPQWLLNIGGSVTRDARPVASGGGEDSPPPPPSPTPSAPPAPTSTPTPSRPGEPDAQAPPPRGDSGAPVPTPPASGAASRSGGDAKANDTLPLPALQVVGGIAVPLYVLILAILGAAVNMTRRVPAIQQDHDEGGEGMEVTSTLIAAPAAALGALRGAWKRTSPLGRASPAPDGAAAGEQTPEGVAAAAVRAESEKRRKKAWWKIRKELIETYMYFLSAPFLAIAVYYLLQIAANSVNEPILVVVAFASGLMSDSVVGTIVSAADRVLKAEKDKGAATRQDAVKTAPAPNGPIAKEQPNQEDDKGDPDKKGQ